MMSILEMQPTHHMLSEDCLNYCFAYLDVKDIGCGVISVSKTWHHLASSDNIWGLLCAELWKDKQNHPFERWAEVHVPSTIMRFRTALNKQEMMGPSHEDNSESGLTGSMLQTMYRSLLDPILEISSNKFSRGVKNEDVAEYNQLLKEMEEVRSLTRHHWRGKLNELIAAEEERFGNNVQARTHAPLSRCIRAEQIDLELERCLTMFEDISTEEFLVLNRRIEHQIQCNLEGK
jgi:hypothetical protein